MNTRNEELPDEEAIDFSPDLIAAQQAEAEKRAREQAEHDDEDEDDDAGSFDEDDADDDDEDDTSHAEGSDDDDDDDDLGDADRDDDDDDDASIARVPKVKKGEGGKRKKQTAQERIEELAEKRRLAEKGQYDAELKVVELEARLEALEKGDGPRKTTSAKDLKQPDPKDFEYGSADDDYVKALVDYEVAKEKEAWLAEHGQSAEESEKQRQINHYKARYAKVQTEGEKKYGEKFKIVEDTNFPSALARDLLDSDQGVDISYFFANNIGELRKVVSMTDAQRAKAIGRLEERFSASASAGKKRSKAPETPSRKNTRRKQSKDDSRYGPDDQDAFDKAFWGR